MNPPDYIEKLSSLIGYLDKKKLPFLALNIICHVALHVSFSGFEFNYVVQLEIVSN
jgi:hypothetical protein